MPRWVFQKEGRWYCRRSMVVSKEGGLSAACTAGGSGGLTHLTCSLPATAAASTGRRRWTRAGQALYLLGGVTRLFNGSRELARSGTPRDLNELAGNVDNDVRAPLDGGKRCAQCLGAAATGHVVDAKGDHCYLL